MCASTWTAKVFLLEHNFLKENRKSWVFHRKSISMNLLKKLKLTNYFCLFARKGYSFSPLSSVIQGKPVNLLSILVSLNLNLKESFSTMSDYMTHFILEDVCICLNINALEYPAWCIPRFMFVDFTVSVLTKFQWHIIE